MTYSDEVIEQLQIKFAHVRGGLERLMTGCLVASNSLQEELAREYLVHGVGRRLGILHKALARIFEIFPVTQTAPLLPEQAQEATINLHAFVINAYGLQDNLAWTYVHENKIPLVRNHVGLFHPKCQPLLPKAIKLFLSEARIQDWFTSYAKDYRDSLAHRIPIYIPPAQYTREEEAVDNDLANLWSAQFALGDEVGARATHERRLAIGKAAPYFMHSHRDRSFMHLHAQLLADGLTVQELVQLFLQSHFKPT